MNTLEKSLLKIAKQNPRVRKALIHELRRAKFERGEDVPLEELPDELQDNVEDPPPEVQDLKEEMQRQARLRRKKAALPNVLTEPLVPPEWKQFMRKFPQQGILVGELIDRIYNTVKSRGLEYAQVMLQTLIFDGLQRGDNGLDPEDFENRKMKILNALK